MSYAPKYSTIGRGTAVIVDKIHKGAQPGDLSIERPARFELVIDRWTAAALGLTTLFQRAVEVIK